MQRMSRVTGFGVVVKARDAGNRLGTLLGYAPTGGLAGREDISGQTGSIMKRELSRAVRSFFLELGVYGVLVAAYYFLVLHFLGGWLQRLYQGHRPIYAFMALLLILGQGLLLETLTRPLLRRVQPSREEG